MRLCCLNENVLLLFSFVKDVARRADTEQALAASEVAAE
jgi:hypothetical protein